LNAAERVAKSKNLRGSKPHIPAKAKRAPDVRPTIVQKLLEGIECGRDSIIIEQVQVRNIQLPDSIQNAINEKLEAQEASERMVFVLQKESQESERKKIEASGIKDFQKIVREGIDEQLLRWRGIEATKELAKSPNTKVIVIGGAGGLPLILNTAGGK